MSQAQRKGLEPPSCKPKSSWLSRVVCYSAREPTTSWALHMPQPVHATSPSTDLFVNRSTVHPGPYCALLLGQNSPHVLVWLVILHMTASYLLPAILDLLTPGRKLSSALSSLSVPIAQPTHSPRGGVGAVLYAEADTYSKASRMVTTYTVL